MKIIFNYMGDTLYPHVYDYNKYKDVIMNTIVPHNRKFYIIRLGDFNINNFHNNEMPYNIKDILNNYNLDPYSMILIQQGDKMIAFAGCYIADYQIMKNIYQLPDLTYNTVNEAINI